MVVTDNTKTTYVIYKKDVESKITLDKFKDILFLAEYNCNLEFVEFESISDIELYISDKISFICINNTYESFYKIIANKYSIPIFEFSLNQYYDEKYNILISGLDLTCDEMFTKTEHKKTTWANFQSFVKYFKKLHFKTKEIVEEVKELKIEELPSIDDSSKFVKTEEVTQQTFVDSITSHFVLDNTNILANTTFLKTSISQDTIQIRPDIVLEFAESLANLSNVLKKFVVSQGGN